MWISSSMSFFCRQEQKYLIYESLAHNISPNETLECIFKRNQSFAEKHPYEQDGTPYITALSPCIGNHNWDFKKIQVNLTSTSVFNVYPFDCFVHLSASSGI